MGDELNMQQYLTDESSRSAAMVYMERVLAKGHTLAKLLLQRVEPRSGIVSVLSPDALDSSQILQFDSGHFPQEPVPTTIGAASGMMSPVADSNDHIALLICELLQASDSVCLIENFVASPGDDWLQRAKSCVVTYNDDVLHAVFSANHAQDRIADTIREARGIPILVGAVGRLNAETAESVQKQKAITTRTLDSIAESVRLIFVGAYDGEGFVLWTQESLPV
jgi:hypothetical protein